MKRKMSKAEKDARHLPLDEDHYIDPSYYAYSSGRKVNLETGKDEAKGRRKMKKETVLEIIAALFMVVFSVFVVSTTIWINTYVAIFSGVTLIPIVGSFFKILLDDLDDDIY